jgi:hypothetical protein
MQYKFLRRQNHSKSDILHRYIKEQILFFAFLRINFDFYFAWNLVKIFLNEGETKKNSFYEIEISTRVGTLKSLNMWLLL